MEDWYAFTKMDEQQGLNKGFGISDRIHVLGMIYEHEDDQNEPLATPVSSSAVNLGFLFSPVTVIFPC